jgi:hypothetical protein
MDMQPKPTKRHLRLKYDFGNTEFETTILKSNWTILEVNWFGKRLAFFGRTPALAKGRWYSYLSSVVTPRDM